MQVWLRKLLFTPIILLYFYLGFLLFFPEVFQNPLYVIGMALLNIILIIDIILRPIPKEKDVVRARLIILLFAICTPILFLIPYLEYKFLLSPYVAPIVDYFSILAIIFILIGGTIAIVSRVQLGQYGSPRIVIQQEHKLIKTGLYKHIRHPMYLGNIIYITGFPLIFSSIFGTLLLLGLVLVLVNNRIKLEECLLAEKFKEQYQQYKSRTRRLIPFIY
jgi:protein-S-isoprenylcysteine O-methyltransferase Ste14